MHFEKIEYLANTYKSGNLRDKLPKKTIYIREFISYFFFGCEFGSYLNQLLHHT